MRQLHGDIHVLRLLGFVNEPHNTIMVLEYCAKGDLLGYLRMNLLVHKAAILTVRWAQHTYVRLHCLL